MTPEQALAIYHKRFDAALFREIQIALVHDVCGAYQAHQPVLRERALALPELNAIMNLVIDSCLEVVGHPDWTGRLLRLVMALAQETVSEQTIHLISAYIARFEQAGNTASADMRNAALASQRLKIAMATVRQVSDPVAHIHSQGGNHAHSLLAAAQFLLEATHALLVGETNTDYLGEKLRRAEQHWAHVKDALHPPAPAPMIPHKTLLLAEDKTYAGIVTDVDANGIRVTWYKWGFASADVVQNWVPASQITGLMVLSPEECTKRFKGLPPTYSKE